MAVFLNFLVGDSQPNLNLRLSKRRAVVRLTQLASQREESELYNTEYQQNFFSMQISFCLTQWLSLALLNVIAGSPAQPFDLSVEYQPIDWSGSPPFVDEPVPRFSWKVQEPEPSLRAVEQIAFQLVVSQETQVMWDSGRVSSNETLFIPYGGMNGNTAGNFLASDTLYEWKVRIWTLSSSGVNESDYASGSFATALMGSSEWPSPWMSSLTNHKQFRAEFTLPSSGGGMLPLRVPIRATAYFVGLGYGRLYLNGQRLQSRGGGDELGPWTTFSKRVLYRAYDVPVHFLNHTNAVGVRIGNGQYNSHWHKGSLAFRMQLHLDYGASSPAVIVAAAPPAEKRAATTAATAAAAAAAAAVDVALTWKDCQAPHTSDDVYNGETWDNRLDIAGWNMPGFNDSNWSTAVPVSSNPRISKGSFEPASAAMSLHAFTPIRAVRVRRPVRMVRVAGSSGDFVFDFGANEVGWPVLNSISGHAPGTAIKMAMGEQLQLRLGGGDEVCLVDCGVEGFASGNATVYYPFGQRGDPGQTDTFILRVGSR
jgi:alpha-L-rhamnosidase